MKTITIILCSFVFASSYDHKRCDKNGTLFYESLSCKPAISQSNSGCPKYFECDHIDGSVDSCSLKGKHYKIGEALEDELQTSNCKADCSCKKRGKAAEFNCATVDCPENEDSEDSECYYAYELGHCCSIHNICPPFSNVTCKVANDIFKEGEQFYAPDSCTECVCREGFQSEFVPPFCQRIKCLVQLDYAEMIAHRCAPVYLTKINGLLCCPTTFICPTADLKFDLITQLQVEEDGFSCTFGDKRMALGTSFNAPVDSLRNNTMAHCKCEIPPFVTCKVYI